MSGRQVQIPGPGETNLGQGQTTERSDLLQPENTDRTDISNVVAPEDTKNKDQSEIAPNTDTMETVVMVEEKEKPIMLGVADEHGKAGAVEIDTADLENEEVVKG